jgi:hypothetical protein
MVDAALQDLAERCRARPEAARIDYRETPGGLDFTPTRLLPASKQSEGAQSGPLRRGP